MFGTSRWARRVTQRVDADAIFDTWVASQAENRRAEERLFRSAIEREIILPPPGTHDSTSEGSTGPTSSAFAEALREIASASIYSQDVARSRIRTELGSQLTALRSISFEADNLLAEIHHSLDLQIESTRSGRTGRPTLWQWLRNPVGSGGVADSPRHDLDRIYRTTAGLRLVGAASCLLFTLAAHLVPAASVLLFSVVMSGTLRYVSNAESAVSFRARYLSCIAGHLGDVVVLLGLVLFAGQHGLHRVAAFGVLTAVAMLFGSMMRTGALSAGVHVTRVRLERVARVGGMSLGMVLFASGFKWGLQTGFAVVLGWAVAEIVRTLIEVGRTNTELFTWVAIARDATVTGEIETMPYGSDRPFDDRPYTVSG